MILQRLFQTMFGIQSITVLFILFKTLQFVQSQYYGCDFYQPLELNRVYDIFSPNFPQFYQPSTMCRWVACAPYGSNIIVNCTIIKLPIVSLKIWKKLKTEHNTNWNKFKRKRE